MQLTPAISEYFFSNISDEARHIAFTTFLTECGSLILIFTFLFKNSAIRNGIHFHIRNVTQIFLIIRGFCKSLPFVLMLSIGWNIILSNLSLLGIKITIESQPIIQILSRGKFHDLPLWLMGISIIILAPVCEEIFFRGILLRFFCSIYSIQKSLWFSSFLFAIFHKHLASFLPLLGLGYGLGRYYASSQNIAVSIGIHSLFNAINFAIVISYSSIF